MPVEFSNGNHLPEDVLTQFLIAWDDTYISSPAKLFLDFQAMIPPAGETSWICGPQGNLLSKSLVHFATFLVSNKKIDTINFVDFNCSKASGKGVHRYSNLVNILEDRFIELSTEKSELQYDQAKLGLKLLNQNLQAWGSVVNLWKKQADLEYLKVARPVKGTSTEKSLMISIQPRKIGFLDLAGAVSSSRTIISDSAKSAISLGSREHFGLNNSDKSHLAIRKMLASTYSYTEQRSVFFNPGYSCIVSRSHVLSPATKIGVADESIPIKNVTRHIHESLPSWEDTCLRLKNSFSDDQFNLLMEKALRMDSSSAKELNLLSSKESGIARKSAAKISNLLLSA